MATSGAPSMSGSQASAFLATHGPTKTTLIPGCRMRSTRDMATMGLTMGERLGMSSGW